MLARSLSLLLLLSQNTNALNLEDGGKKKHVHIHLPPEIQNEYFTMIGGCVSSKLEDKTPLKPLFKQIIKGKAFSDCLYLCELMDECTTVQVKTIEEEKFECQAYQAKDNAIIGNADSGGIDDHCYLKLVTPAKNGVKTMEEAKTKLSKLKAHYLKANEEKEKAMKKKTPEDKKTKKVKPMLPLKMNLAEIDETPKNGVPMLPLTIDNTKIKTSDDVKFLPLKDAKALIKQKEAKSADSQKGSKAVENKENEIDKKSKILPEGEIKTVKVNADYIKEKEKDDSIDAVAKHEKVRTATFIMLAIVLAVGATAAGVIFWLKPYLAAKKAEEEQEQPEPKGENESDKQEGGSREQSPMPFQLHKDDEKDSLMGKETSYRQ